MGSLLKEENQDNIGSLVSISFVNVNDVEYVPDPIGLNLNEPVLLKDDKTWSKIEVTQETPGFDIDPNTSQAGNGNSLSVKGVIAGHNSVLESRMQQMREDRFLVMVTDFEGRKRLIGTLANPVRFKWSFGTGTKTSGRKGYEIQFYQIAGKTPLYYQSPFDEIPDESGDPVDPDSYLAQLEARLQALENEMDDVLYQDGRYSVTGDINWGGNGINNISYLSGVGSAFDLEEGKLKDSNGNEIINLFDKYEGIGIPYGVRLRSQDGSIESELMFTGGIGGVAPGWGNLRTYVVGSGDYSYPEFQSYIAQAPNSVYTASYTDTYSSGIGSYNYARTIHGSNVDGDFVHITNTIYINGDKAYETSLSNEGFGIVTNASGTGYLKSDYLLNNVVLQFPNKTAGEYTIATLGDIPSVSGYLANTLSSTNIFVGNNSNLATGVSLTLNSSGGTFGLSNAGVLTIPNAATGTRGLLTSTDWNTFNNKVSSQWTTSGSDINYNTGNVLIGTTTLTAGQNKFSVAATMPSTISSTNNAIDFNITSAGSSNQVNRAMLLTYGAGYTGGNATVGLQVISMTASTGSNITLGTGNVSLTGNASGTTSGMNTGNRGIASNGDKNIGVVGIAITLKNSATNVGGMFLGNNSGTTPVQIGVYAGLNTSDPTWAASAALIADNASVSAPIALFRSNGNAIITMASAGNMYFKNISTSSNVTDSFQLYATDYVAGNSVPHFKTENGDVLKLAADGGWSLPTGTATKGGWATSTATTQQVAETVKALMDHFMTNLGFCKA